MDIKNNIDDAIRKKFDSFEPTPPPYVWEEIEKGINSKKPFVPFSKKWVIGSALILLALSSIILVDPFGILSNSKSINEQVIENIANTDIDQKTETIENQDQTEAIDNEPSKNNITIRSKSTTKSEGAKDKPTDNIADETEITKYNSEFGSGYIGSVGMKHSDFLLNEDIVPTIEELIIPSENLEENNIDDKPLVEEEPTVSKGHWEIGLNIWPELTVSKIDSVDILNTYSINIEPTYFFNNH